MTLIRNGELRIRMPMMADTTGNVSLTIGVGFELELGVRDGKSRNG